MSYRKQAWTAVALAALVHPLAAQGWIERPVTAPQGAIEKIRSAVTVTLQGRVSRVTVEEWFRNSGAVLDEGTYLYPLPGEASFSDFSLWQGDRELKGEIMDASQARGIYEEIVRRRRDPALIELAGNGVLRARVFPIAPGETRKITLRYTQMLDRAGDAWRFRYIGGRGPGAHASRSFRLTAASGGTIGDPYSPTHRLGVRREGDRLEVTSADSIATDLELFLPIAQPRVGLTLVTHQPAGESGYFMLLLAPGRSPAAARQPRDLVAVLDVSGSMSGAKLDQAKAALVQLLRTLHEGDRFRLVAFSGGVRRLADGWTAVSPATRQSATEWIRGLETEGGTNIAGALEEAFAAPPAEDALGVVVFLTDGQPTAGETDPERIAARAESSRGRFRAFAFGIGDDVNTFLLDRLTERARGATEYLSPGADIETAVGTLATKVESPVLTDLVLTAGGAEVYDVQPGTLPDLFGGEEMVVFGRYRGTARRDWSVTVRGRRSGHPEQFHTGADAPSDAASYVPQLWATRKAGALAREIRLHGQSRELLDALKELALRYGILTEYTAYLVQEPDQVARRAAEDQILAQPAPATVAGVGAVAAAKSQNALARASSAADTELMNGPGALTSPTRRIGGRLYVLRDSLWTDLAHQSGRRTVRVEAYSSAYFALLQALPELVAPAALQPGVRVAGRLVSVEIQREGRTAWRPGELEALVREFRS